MVDTDRITDAARDIGGKIQGAVGELAGSHRDSVEGRVREARGGARTLYGQARDAVRHAADDVSDHTGDALEQGRRYAWEGHQASTEWPHATLLVAGLVGFGLGVLVSKL